MTFVDRIKMLFVVACAAAALGHNRVEAGTITVWNRAVVTTDQVRLADVAQLDGFDAQEAARLSEIIVLPAPEVGNSSLLSLDGLGDPLIDAGVNMADVTLRGAMCCRIERPRHQADFDDHPSHSKRDQQRQPESPRTLRAQIRELLQRQLGRIEGSLSIDFGRVDPSLLSLSEPQFEFRIRQSSGRLLGPIRLQVDVTSAAELVRSELLQIHVSLLRKVVVASRAINLGETISSDNTRYVDRLFDQLDKLGAAKLAEVVGQRTKRLIPEGNLVTLQDLEPIPLVKRGQLVDVSSVVGGVSITSVARALDEGVYGDVLPLRVGDRRTGRKLTGRVVGPGKVEVGNPSQAGNDDATILVQRGAG